jgi:2-keto-4-pentenoate hydratase
MSENLQPHCLTEALWVAAGTGILVPAPLDQLSSDAAYRAQEDIFDRRGSRLAGWKLAATSKAAQEAMKLSCPVAGRLATSDVVASHGQVDAVAGTLYAEAELAVTLRSDLPPRPETYREGEVASAIGEVQSAIELCTSRYRNDDVEAGALIADNAFAYRLVLGRRIASEWDPEFNSMAVNLECGTGAPVHGSTSAVMGGPLAALVWLANWLSDQRIGLKAGQIVATGSCTGVTRVHAGDTLRARFAGVDSVAVTITPRTQTRRLG